MIESPPPIRNAARERLERLASRAALILGWERVWPVMVAALTIVGLFVAVSFLGLWLEAPRWGRMLGLILFGLALAAALGQLAGLRWPSRAERLARLDRDSGLAHRPATTMDDQLANGADHPATRALWSLHRKRAEQAALSLRLAPPSPRIVEHDRYALRAAAVIAVVATGFVAGPEKYARVLAAFDWRTAGALSQGYRLDAWIDPPAYTGRPPIVLNLRDEADARFKTGANVFSAPVGSTIIVRASAGAHVTVDAQGGVAPAKADEAAAARPAPAPGPSASEPDMRFTLVGDGRLTLKRFGSTVATFALSAMPDLPPTIVLKGEPKANARGSLTLGYKIDDDYGVIGAEAQFSKPVIAGKAVTGRTLVEPPKMPLALPSGAGGLGDAETTADLSEHPWAGGRVTMTLSARDEGGNEGRSAPIQMTLPQRQFTVPLARALVEQRRNLVLAPDDNARVSVALDALMIAPETFNIAPGVYLGLRSIATRLADARTDADLIDAADLMWAMALRLEDGDLTDAERDLRAAEQQLSEAMQRGASDEELKRLMDQLRAAMDKFTSEMARRDPNAQESQIDPNARMVTPQDLQSMMDRMRDAMKNGDMAEARRMLNDLKNLMENLQTAQPGRPDPRSREMNQALDEIDRLTREEQDLRDRTFRRDQKQQQGQRGRKPNGQPGDQAGQGDEQDQQSADNGEDSPDALQKRQQDLRKRLDELKERMRQFGMDGKEGLNDAESEMRDAEGKLGRGDPGRGDAADAEGRAVDALRRSGQALAQQMQQGQGQQAGQAGRGSPNGTPRDGRDSANSDPLGRDSMDRRAQSTQRYDPLGAPLAERAQRVLEELRKRLSDPARPRLELDYLERLLNRY